jgi:hypothetical protein
MTLQEPFGCEIANMVVMAIWVVDFSSKGYKNGKIFASTYPEEMIEF